METQFKYNIGDTVIYMMGALPLMLTVKNRWLYRQRILYSFDQMSTQLREDQITLA